MNSSEQATPKRGVSEADTLKMSLFPTTEGPAGEGPIPSGLDRQKRKARIKLILMIAVFAGCIALLHFGDLRSYLQDVQQIKRYLDGTGNWAPFIFVMGFALLLSVGTPRLVICGIGGFLFGFVEGLLLSQAGSLIGSYAVFLFARWGGGAWLAEKADNRPKLSRLLKNPSTSMVFIIRQLPLYGTVSNVVLGMAHTPHVAFLAGSFLGFLPSSIAATLIGGGLGKESPTFALLQIITAAIVLSISAVFVLRVRKLYYSDER